MNKETKICRNCGLELPVEEFSKKSQNKAGLDSYCKICKNQLIHKYMMICSECGKIMFSTISDFKNRRTSLCRSCISSKRMKQRLGEKHPNWKSKDVGLKALHIYLRKHNPPKTDKCFFCGEPTENLQLMCVGAYKRDINQFRYACSRCHTKFDKANRWTLCKSIITKLIADGAPKKKVDAMLHAMYDTVNRKACFFERLYKLEKELK